MADRLEALEELVDTLRGPEGCPWDRKQRLPDLRAYLLEEAHELAAAIDARDLAAIQEELGDLAFQLVFLSRLLDQEHDSRSLTAALEGIHAKMVDRHPHVFGGERLESAEAVHQAWEAGKEKQRGSNLRAFRKRFPRWSRPCVSHKKPLVSVSTGAMPATS